MGLLARLRRGFRTERLAQRRRIELRIDAQLFAAVREHVEDFSRGEEAGFLLCSLAREDERDLLLARRWLPIPETVIARRSEGSVLSWSAQFNSDVLAAALEFGATPVLVHSHGSTRPSFSADDRRRERPLFSAFSRIVDPLPTGSLLLGDGDATGSFRSAGEERIEFTRLVIIGDRIDVWPAPGAATPPLARRRLDRQSRAIGPASDAKLAATRVAVVGLSGGGSHVVQQLAHQGVGGLIVIDDEIVDDTNLGRLVGATAADVGKTKKVDLARRVATSIDPEIALTEVEARFPSPSAIAALKGADVIVACVDRFDAREAINAFARRHLIPLLDIGMTIRSGGERLLSADGQVIASIPGRPCMRCWFLTDALLAAERRERPAGYDRNPDAAGDPQVVSMNGVLASQACNLVLELITGYGGGLADAGHWRYDGRLGVLEPHQLPPARPDCPACAEEGHGDPAFAARNAPAAELPPIIALGLAEQAGVSSAQVEVKDDAD